jgi:P27 family predicted phage terminase small subunit
MTRKLKPQDIIVNPATPEQPKYLDKVGRDHWQSTVDLLDKAGNLSRIDRDALGVYCSLFSRWREAEANVKSEGAVITARNGYRQPNPWYTIAVQCQKDMKPFLEMFGMSPKARANLPQVDAIEDDPLQRFLRGE